MHFGTKSYLKSNQYHTAKHIHSAFISLMDVDLMESIWNSLLCKNSWLRSKLCSFKKVRGLEQAIRGDTKNFILFYFILSYTFEKIQIKVCENEWLTNYYQFIILHFPMIQISQNWFSRELLKFKKA